MASSSSSWPLSSSTTFSIDDLLLPDFQCEYQYIEKKNSNYKSYLLPLLLYLQEIDKETVLLSLSKETEHFPLLLRLFPHLRIDSYYAREKKPYPRVNYYSSFSLEDCKRYNKNVFFYVESVHLSVNSVVSYYFQRLKLIRHWYRALQPRYSLIKFSLPYPGQGIENLTFLDGTLIVPPYTDRSWTFLIPNGLLKSWSVREYDGRVAYAQQVLKRRVYLSDSPKVKLDYNEAYCKFVLNGLSFPH